ncbi:MAG: hypothetical protein LDL41_09665 [Coleofasciculus sp. S288]|nr:hypothetical protein [Coleofasciculus sp. S288]
MLTYQKLALSRNVFHLSEDRHAIKGKERSRSDPTQGFTLLEKGKLLYKKQS